MQETIRTFDKIFAKWNWNPIRNCPGRFIFADGSTKLTVADVLGTHFPIHKFKSPAVPDEVLVIRFCGAGGLISYIKPDHRFLHTLNNEDGFARKLRQLEIVLPDID